MVSKKIKPTKKFRKKCEIYKLFATDEGLDFSDEAMIELYMFETYGEGNILLRGFGTSQNGYAIGKKWCDLFVTTWLDHCKMFIDGEENKSFYGWGTVITMLYSDPYFKNYWWWLDSIFKNFIKEKDKIYDATKTFNEIKEEVKNG